MGSDAIMIDKNGKRTPVTGGCLRTEDYDNDFICAGITEEGILCGVPVSVVRAAERRKEHFRAYSEAHPHIKGCPFCEKRKKITIEMLDRSGKGKTTQDVFARLNKEKMKRRKSPKGGKIDPEEPSEINTEDEDYTENEREIRTKERLPQTLSEHVMLLQSLDTKDVYADSLVFDQILDERTIDAYRRMPIPVGKPFVITARKTLPYKYMKNLENNQWVLIDYWAKDTYSPLVFVLTVTPGAKQKLYNLCQLDPAAKIHVYAIFKKHPTLPFTYLSELVRAQMICASFDDSVS